MWSFLQSVILVALEPSEIKWLPLRAIPSLRSSIQHTHTHTMNIQCVQGSVHPTGPPTYCHWSQSNNCATSCPPIGACADIMWMCVTVVSLYQTWTQAQRMCELSFSSVKYPSKPLPNLCMAPPHDITVAGNVGVESLPSCQSNGGKWRRQAFKANDVWRREGRMKKGGRDEAEAAARLRLQNQHLLCLQPP